MTVYEMIQALSRYSAADTVKIHFKDILGQDINGGSLCKNSDGSVYAEIEFDDDFRIVGVDTDDLLGSPVIEARY